MKNLVIAALLGLVKVEAFRIIDASKIQLKDEDGKEMIDDTDVVIQIYDSNLENGDSLTPPTASDNSPDDSDDFLQIKSNLRFRPDPAQSPWAAKPAPGDKNDITGGFTVADIGSDYYSRTVPALYGSTEKDDLLMRSAIENYAVEGKGDDGAPNGKFFITRADMNGLADEVIMNNLGFKDASKRQAYANEHLQKTWDHFDMFKKGYIPVQEVPQFCRILIGEVEVQNSLQVQLADSEGSVTFSRPYDDVVLQFRPNPAQSPWAAKGKDPPSSPIHNAFQPHHHGMWEYERKVPDLYDSTDKDDLLMRSVIQNYALEGRGDDGRPNGKFYLTQSEFYNVGAEVVGTHIGYKGAKLTAYLDQHVPTIFKHLDVNNQGYIIAEKAP